MGNGRTPKEKFDKAPDDKERLWMLFDTVYEIRESLKKKYITRTQLLIFFLVFCVVCLGGLKIIPTKFLMAFMGV